MCYPMMKRSLLLSFLCLLWATGAFAQGDAIDLSQAVVHNSPPDVATWAKTTRISTLTMRPEGTGAAGLSFDAASHLKWPDYTPPGWDGPIQYTVWAGVKINGVWHISGFIQMWRDRVSTGAPLLSSGPRCGSSTNWTCNWADPRWGVMHEHTPVVGEAMVFFLTAGNARFIYTATSVKERSNVVMVNLPAGDNGVFNFPFVGTWLSGDFDGDGRADPTIYRPGTGTFWVLNSMSSFGASQAIPWGLPGDIPVPADYSGDGRVDPAVYRPSNGTWYVKTPTSTWMMPWGMPGDIPIPEDFDGDGKADLVVYRPSNGMWVVRFSSTNFQTWWQSQWGAPGDIPVAADGDGDHKADLVVFRPSAGAWFARSSSSGYTDSRTIQFGIPGDMPLSADFDGDGRSDIVIYRPSNGGWYVLLSSQNFSPGAAVTYGFGTPGDIPMPQDVDGDMKADLVVWRPSTGLFFTRYSSTGYGNGPTLQWGTNGDLPVPLQTGVTLTRPFITNVAPTRPSGVPAGTPMAWIANVTGGVAPQTFKFLIFNGVSWSVGQDWTPSNVWNWTPPAAGTYTVQVWVRNAGSSADFDAWMNSQTFIVAPPAPLSVIGLVADRTFPIGAGTPVTFTAAASGGSGPYAYKFWVFNGSTWVLVRDWSSSNQWTWGSQTPGAYQIQVWVRNAGSSADVADAFANSPVLRVN
jgi:hypothetical protein